jgi:hypothetical protein
MEHSRILLQLGRGTPQPAPCDQYYCGADTGRVRLIFVAVLASGDPDRSLSVVHCIPAAQSLASSSYCSMLWWPYSMFVCMAEVSVSELQPTTCLMGLLYSGNLDVCGQRAHAP